MIRHNLKITQYRDYLAKLLFVQTGPVIAEEIFKYISVKIGPISTFSKKSPILRITPKTTTKYQTIFINILSYPSMKLQFKFQLILV
jgi:hypothetical protein